MLSIFVLSSCTADIPIQEEVVLSNTTSEAVSHLDSITETGINNTAVNEIETTTSIINITEPPIDNYNAADYNPLYIDFNKDGVDEVVYRVPNNPIEKRVCIEIDGNESLFPDINSIYCYYYKEFNADTNQTDTHGEFIFSYSNYGYIKYQGYVIPEWSNSMRWEWSDKQYFTGKNDSCMGPRLPASDSYFYDVIDDNHLSSYYTMNRFEKFELNFYKILDSIGYVNIDDLNSKIILEKLNIISVEENIKLSNSKDYSVTTFNPDQIFLYKRQRLLNPDYNGDDRQTEVQTEYMLLLKHESDNTKVVDGIFLGTKKENYLAHYFRYIYDIDNNKYTHNDIIDGIATDDIFPYTRIINKSKKSNDYIAQYCRYSYYSEYDGYVYNNITDTTASAEFNNQWNIVGNQNIDDRWELVGELSISD
jgi:hypothetical protein